MTNEQINALTNVQALKTYMELDGGRKLEMSEMKALTSDERQELGTLAKAALVERFQA